MPSNTPSLTGIASTSVTTASTHSASTVTPAISALKNFAQSGQSTGINPMAAAATQAAAAALIHKPIVSTADVTKMESTAVSRPELKLQTVPVITGLNLPRKDTAQKPSVKSPPMADSTKTKPAVTILDFADMISPEEQEEKSKLLHSQQPTPAKQQLASFLNKTPSSPKEKPRDQPLTHLPSSVATTTISLPVHSSTISPSRTQTAMTSPPKVIRSSSVVVPSTGQSPLLAASVGHIAAAGLQNNFIDLALSLRQQQQQQEQKSVADLVSTLRQQQQQQQQQQQHQPKSTIASVPPAPPQTILDITSPRR